MKFSLNFYKHNQSIMSFKITVALLIFYLDDMPINISGVLKFSTVIVLLLSSFMSV